MQVCYLWAPSALTAQYAYSQQLPTSEDLDEFDQVGLEMQLPASGAEFVIDDGDDDDYNDQTNGSSSIGNGQDNLEPIDPSKLKVAVD